MSKTVRLRKGLDIRLLGEAEKVMTDLQLPAMVSIKPSDFHGLVPKMVVRPGDRVKIGSVIFYDKYNESIKFVSPVAGEIKEIVRGAKRRILEVHIATNGTEAESHQPNDPLSMSGEDVKASMLSAGLWPFIKQRPLDVIADPSNEPKSIFVTGFDSAPLAADMDFIVHGQGHYVQNGLNALTKLTSGKVHLTLNGKTTADEALTNAKNVQINTISGKHPAGNVGTQIHHFDPVNKGEFVWTLNIQDVINIGKFFAEGKFDASRIVALTGSEAKNRKYFRTVIGAPISSIVSGNVEGDNVRIISGNVLTGTKVDEDGYLGFYSSQVTVIPEGNQYKFFLTKGWLGLGFDKFSLSKTFPTGLVGKKKFRLDTNLNGEERAFVVTGELEKVFPFDILPMQLVKAAITKDIDGMEKLGIYEVAPEDFALCEYVCTTKIEIQEKVREGLDLIASECM